MTAGVNWIRIVNSLLWLRILMRGGDRRLRCTREGRLSGWIRVTETGFRAASEHCCQGAQATSQDVIPGF